MDDSMLALASCQRRGAGRVDSNLATGAAANIDAIAGSFGSTELGIEYDPNLFTEFSNPGFVSLEDPINVTHTQVLIAYGASSVTIHVPLSVLGNDDGLVNHAVVVGDFAFAQDQTLDASVVQTGGLPASRVPVPEPGTALLLGAGLAALATPRRGQRRRARVARGASTRNGLRGAAWRFRLDRPRFWGG